MERQSSIAKTIDDCKIGGYAELELFIVKLYQKKTTRICSACDSSECQPYCGKKRYVDKMMYFYEAADGNGKLINVRNVPWSNVNLGNIREANLYRISGKIEKPFNGKLDLIVNKIEVIANFSRN